MWRGPKLWQFTGLTGYVLNTLNGHVTIHPINSQYSINDSVFPQYFFAKKKQMLKVLLPKNAHLFYNVFFLQLLFNCLLLNKNTVVYFLNNHQ